MTLNAETAALDLKDQVIFGWLYLRHHLGDGLGWPDPEKVRLFAAPELASAMLERVSGSQNHFFPHDSRPRLQLIGMRQVTGGFVFTLREAEDSELSQLIASGSGYLEIEVEVVDGSAWRLLRARRVSRLNKNAALWSSRIDPVGRLLLAPDGRQVVVAEDGQLTAVSTLDEVPPRYRVEPESGHGQWYRSSSLARAAEWARHFSREEEQGYHVYDRESLESQGTLVAVFAAGEPQPV